MERVFENCGLIEREVVRGELDGRQTYTMILESYYETTIDNLWEAITKKERLARWFAPVEGDLRLGGNYKIDQNASGIITHCIEKQEFRVTWEYGGDVSWLNVLLTEISKEKVLLRLEHLTYAEGEHFKMYGPGATGVGWDMAVCTLNYHVRTGESVSENALLPTPEGKDFIVISADAWGKATTTAGYDQEWSVAAAKNTEKFYLGE